MKSSIVLVAAAFLCLVAFPTTTVGKDLRGWPNPSEITRNQMLFVKNVYKDSKVWKCTYSNGSAPAISISPSAPYTPSPSTPSTPTPSTPSTPTPSTPSPSPPTPKTSPPPPTPSPPPPTPKKSPPPPTPSPPPPTPKKFPSPPPATPSPSTPSTPSNPPPEHHHNQNPWEHIESCMRNMGPVTQCRMQMEFSYFTRMFHVSDYCCNLIVSMRNECEDVIWGFFTDPFFVPLVRCTCHVTF